VELRFVYNFSQVKATMMQKQQSLHCRWTHMTVPLDIVWSLVQVSTLQQQTKASDFWPMWWHIVNLHIGNSELILLSFAQNGKKQG